MSNSNKINELPYTTPVKKPYNLSIIGLLD